MTDPDLWRIGSMLLEPRHDYECRRLLDSRRKESPMLIAVPAAMAPPEMAIPIR
jgi:hypothetical protein